MGLQVKEIMDSNPIVVAEDCSIFGIREIIILRQPDCILVTNKENKLVGILTNIQLT